MQTMPVERLQRLSDEIQRIVLALEGGAVPSNRIKVEYDGGFSLMVSQAYLEMPGHDLEDMIRERIPHLRRFHQDGQLLLAIIDPLLVEFPAFLPLDLRTALERLLDDEPV